MTGAKRTQIADIARAVTDWACRQSDIRAVAMVGSHTRNAARSDSDVDFVLLTSDKFRYFVDADWVQSIEWYGTLPTRFRDVRYGACASRHLHFEDGPEVEMGFVDLSWASSMPVDQGTQTVIAGGCRVLYDPDDLLADMLSALSIGPAEPA